MSLLGVNGFGDSSDGQNTGNVSDYGKQKEDMTSIFDEIEHLLLHNECLETEAKAEVPTTVASNSPVASNGGTAYTNGAVKKSTVCTSIDKSDEHLSLDFLAPCAENGFLIPEDTNTLPEELSLYTVKHDELEPINSPFMVPGIYKKIAPASTEVANGVSSGVNIEASNVFLAVKEPSGRIVSRTDFKKIYIPSNGCELTAKCQALPPAKKEPVRSAIPTDVAANKTSDKQWDALSKLACNIFRFSEMDHIVIDRKRNEVVRTNAATNQKTIYRFPAPNDLSLTQQTMHTNTLITTKIPPTTIKPKLGRPRKRTSDEAIKNKPAILLKKSKDCEMPLATVRNDTIKPALVESQQPQLRTRSGRVVKIIKTVPTTTANNDEPAETNDVLLANFLHEQKDADFHYKLPTKPTASTEQETMPIPLATSSPTKRHTSRDWNCPTCGKTFLGRRLQKHFAQYPDHMQSNEMQNPPAPPPPPPPPQMLINECAQEYVNEEMTLFRFLIAKIQKSSLNEDQRADLFLHEINDLVEQLQLRSSRLIRNTSGLHFVTARTARVLGIPEGQYALDMSAIEAPPELENNCMASYEHKSIPPVATVSTRSLDYTAISLDDTLTDEAAQKLNLSAGGKLLPPSEESLLRAVGDLVPDGVTKLVEESLRHPPRSSVQSSTVTGMVPHYDHVSDNAVEAITIKGENAAQQETPIMGLAVDFFQFKNN